MIHLGFVASHPPPLLITRTYTTDRSHRLKQKKQNCFFGNAKYYKKASIVVTGRKNVEYLCY
jgi:hypothetical protein